MSHAGGRAVAARSPARGGRCATTWPAPGATVRRRRDDRPEHRPSTQRRRRPPRRMLAAGAFGLLAVAGAAGSYFAVVSGLGAADRRRGPAGSRTRWPPRPAAGAVPDAGGASRRSPRPCRRTASIGAGTGTGGRGRHRPRRAAGRPVTPAGRQAGRRAAGGATRRCRRRAPRADADRRRADADDQSPSPTPPRARPRRRRRRSARRHPGTVAVAVAVRGPRRGRRSDRWTRPATTRGAVTRAATRTAGALYPIGIAGVRPSRRRTHRLPADGHSGRRPAARHARRRALPHPRSRGPWWHGDRLHGGRRAARAHRRPEDHSPVAGDATPQLRRPVHRRGQDDRPAHPPERRRRLRPGHPPRACRTW